MEATGGVNTQRGTKDWIEVEVVSNLTKFANLAIIEFRDNREGVLTPQRIREVMNVLTACAGLLIIESGKLEIMEAEHFQITRKDQSSDKQAHMLWTLTDEGKRQIEVKAFYKAIEKIISACRTTLRQLEFEARSNY